MKVFVGRSKRIKFRKTTFLLLAFALILSAILTSLLTTAQIAEAAVPPDSCFSFNSGTETIEDYYDYENNNPILPACTKNVDIPSTIGGTAVTNIGNHAFATSYITAVTIPSSVLIIEDYAFYGNQITSLSIGSSVTTIGDSAFMVNQLSSVTIPDSVISIGDNAFHSNSLTSVSLGSSVNTIGSQAFFASNITSIIIPDSVTTIGQSAFTYNQLSSVTIGDSVTLIDDQAFSGNNISSLTLGSSVITIGDSAFQNNQISSVTIPNSVIEISEWAFAYNSLTSLSISNFVTNIGESAFRDNQISSLTIGTSVTSIGNDAFYSNQLTSVSFPDSVINIGSNSFQNNQLLSVLFGNTVNSIGDYAFQNNHITSVFLPNSLTSIGLSAFQQNQISSLTIPSSVISMGDNAFQNNKIASLTLPNSMISIGNYVFSNNKLTAITLPSGVTSIGDNAFQNNLLSSIIIPASVTSLGEKAFSRNQIASVSIPITVTSLGSGVFKSNFLSSVTYDGVTTNNDTPLVPECFTFDSGINTITGINYVDLTVLQTIHNACIGQDLNIPSSIGGVVVNNISDEALSLEFNFNKITIPSSVTTIEDSAFTGNNLAEVTIPDSVNSLNPTAFYFQSKIGGTNLYKVQNNIADTAVVQEFYNSAIYTNIYASPAKVISLGLMDVSRKESDEGADFNADSDQTDVISGQLINPARITASYKDEVGNTIAPNTTFTGIGLSNYLAIDNPTNNLGLYYREGGSFNMPTAPTISGYDIVTTPSNIVSLSAGNNSVTYVYEASGNQGENNGGNNGNGNPSSSNNIADLFTPTSSISEYSNRPLTLTTPLGTDIISSSTTPEASLPNQDNSYQYPLGLVNFSFTTNLSSNQVTLNYITNLTPKQVTARKYNPNTNNYYNLPANANVTITETTINNQHALSLTYTITDNGELDLNNNLGTITDPVGLAVSNATYDRLANTGSNNLFQIFTALSLIIGPLWIYKVVKSKRNIAR